MRPNALQLVTIIPSFSDQIIRNCSRRYRQNSLLEHIHVHIAQPFGLSATTFIQPLSTDGLLFCHKTNGTTKQCYFFLLPLCAIHCDLNFGAYILSSDEQTQFNYENGEPAPEKGKKNATLECAKVCCRCRARSLYPFLRVITSRPLQNYSSSLQTLNYRFHHQFWW